MTVDIHGLADLAKIVKAHALLSRNEVMENIVSIH